MKKHNFKTMAVLFTVALLFATGCGANNTPDNNNTSNNDASGQQSSTLTEADARQIALRKAGIDTATFTKQEYDAEDVDYEFEFHTDGKEYECEVSARDGKIKNYDVENISGSSDILD